MPNQSELNHSNEPLKSSVGIEDALEKPANPFKAMLLADQKFDLLSLNLAYNDKMSMMVGVEARVPFLDLQMVRLMNSLPLDMKLRGTEMKYILKKAMESNLPNQIIYRKKAGYSLPIRSWFKNKNDILNSYLNHERIRKQGIYNPVLIDKMIKNQLSGKNDHSYTLFSLLCQQIWIDNTNDKSNELNRNQNHYRAIITEKPLPSINKKKIYNQLVFLCGARDFHAMDWYKSSKELMPEKDIIIVTDLIAGEGFKKLIGENDIVFKLTLLDRILFKRQSLWGHKWRNLIKALIFPYQVLQLKKFARDHKDALYHAHSMYYLMLAWAARIPFVGTPQGSDILIKPFSSFLYKYFASKSLLAAKAITIDSISMKEKVFELAGIEAQIIQNGIDIEAINMIVKKQNDLSGRVNILSSRAFTSIYRIREIILARNTSKNLTSTPLTFISPFSDKEYFKELNLLLNPHDKVLGRMDRMKMYELLKLSKLVISIPVSDSSPRSVYEAVFCGCAVAITNNPYYNILPECMKSRIIIVDLNDKKWLEKAIEQSNHIIMEPFIPSELALEMFDQRRSFMKIQKLLFD